MQNETVQTGYEVRVCGCFASELPGTADGRAAAIAKAEALAKTLPAEDVSEGQPFEVVVTVDQMAYRGGEWVYVGEEARFPGSKQ